MRNTTQDRANTTRDRVGTTSDQDWKVVGVSEPQQRPISQKPEALTCDQTLEATPMATTPAATATEEKSPAIMAGPMIEAPVVAATVAEPCAPRMAMVTR